MKIQTLEYFIVLAESNSINEAAQKLYLGQSSLTKALQLMEKELGITLFTRSKTGIVLTEAGRKILPEAKQTVGYYNGWCNLSQQNALKRVDICSHLSLAGFLVPDIAVRFRERYPDVKVKCFTNSNPEQYFFKADSKSILALCICSDQLYQELTQKLGSEPLVLMEGYYGCLVSRESPLAQKSVVSFDDLKEYYLALPSNVFPENVEQHEAWASCLEAFLPEMIRTITLNRIVQVEAVSSVIDLAMERPEVFAISFSPAHYRYRSVRAGNLINVPMEKLSTKGRLCLLYSPQTCRQYPVFQELVNAIVSDCKSFAVQFDGAEKTSISERRSVF